MREADAAMAEFPRVLLKCWRCGMPRVADQTCLSGHGQVLATGWLRRWPVAARGVAVSHRRAVRRSSEPIQGVDQAPAPVHFSAALLPAASPTHALRRHK